jgi:hypothetical protein
MQDRRQRWAWTYRYAVPLFVASLVSVILSGSGFVAVLVLDNADDTGGDEIVEELCETGTWRVTNYTEQGALGSARMIEGEPTFQFHDDGTGLADFGNATRMEVESIVGTAVGDITGQITYRYEASSQTLEFLDQQSNAAITSDQEFSDLLPPGEFTLPTGPLEYTCDGDEMTFTDGEQAFELEQV